MMSAVARGGGCLTQLLTFKAADMMFLSCLGDSLDELTPSRSNNNKWSQQKNCEKNK